MSRNLIHVLKAVLKTDIKEFKAKFEQAGGSLDKFRKNFDRTAGGIKKAATRITAAAAGIATGVGLMAAKTGISFNAMAEQAEIAFTTMLGSASKARQFMGELREFAKKTPFEVPGLIQTSQQLLAFGFAANKIFPMLTKIGDATAGLGGSPELMKQITRALGQMQAKGKTSAQEMLQLAEAGIPAWEFLAKKLGVDIPTAMEKVEKEGVAASITIEAILEGMDAKFGGLMEAQSQTFNGLMSTIKDTLSQAAGTMFQPVFVEVKKLVSSIAKALESPEFAGAVKRLGLRMKTAIGSVLGGFDSLTPERLISGLEQAISKGIDLLQSLGSIATKVGPSLLRLADFMGQVAGWVVKLMDVVPGLAGLFVALKVGSILGLNQALGGLFGLLKDVKVAAAGSTSVFGKFANSVVSVKGGVIALAAVITSVVVKAMFDAAAMTKKWNEELERSKKLSNDMSTINQKRASRTISKGLGISDPRQQQKFFDDEIAKASLSMSQKSTAVSRAKKNVDDAMAGTTTGPNSDLPMGKRLELANEELAEATQKYQEQKTILQDLREAKRDGAEIVKEEIAAKRKAAEEEKKAKAKAKEEANTQAQEFGMTIESAPVAETPDVAQPDPILDALTKEGDRIAASKEGAAPQMKALADQLIRLREEGKLTDQQANEFTKTSIKMRKDLVQGKMTLDQFSSGMANLSQKTTDAWNATKAKAEQERKEAFLKGDFKGAGLDVKKAVQERLAAFRMSQFNQQVDIAWQKFARLNGLIPNVNKGFQGLRTGMDRFGAGMQRAVKNVGNTVRQIDPQQAAQAFAQINQFLGSRQGVIASIRNQIQLLQQTIPILHTFRQQENVRQQIGQLMGRLNDLLAPRAPAITGMNSLRDVFRDPGLQTQSTASNSFTINFRSLGAPTVEEQRQITDSVEQELQRRGYR